MDIKEGESEQCPKTQEQRLEEQKLEDNVHNQKGGRNEARQKVVVICMLTFGFIYTFHLIKESVIFLYEIHEDSPLDVSESDIQLVTFCWVVFAIFLIAGISVLVYIWLKSHDSKYTIPPSKEE